MPSYHKQPGSRLVGRSGTAGHPHQFRVPRAHHRQEPQGKDHLSADRLCQVPPYEQPVAAAAVLLAFCLSFTISMLFGFGGHYIPYNFCAVGRFDRPGTGFDYLATKMGIRRFYLVAAVTVFAGVVIFTLNLPDPWPYALLIVWRGSPG